MKQLAVIILVFVAFAAANVIQPDVEFPEYTAYGYLERIGMPAAERIEKAEKELLKKSGSRIYNGSPAQLGQFKYQAGLIGEFVGTTNRSVCGAVVISSTRLLTAAHCWTDGQNQVSRYTVVLASVLLFSGGVRIQADDVVVHPGWFPLLFRNDIGIIKLEERIPDSDYIQPIALPSGLQLLDNFADEQAIASGFGITSDGANIADYQYLSYGRMTVLDNSYCLNFFPELVFQDSNICTRTLLSASTCGGDSGGPLVVMRNDEPLLIGLTSYGLRWCTVGFPAAFVRVSSFIRFINDNL